MMGYLEEIIMNQPEKNPPRSPRARPCVFLMHVARLCALVCISLSPSPPSRSPAMGNLIKVLGKDLENCPHFFLDFESK